MGYTQGVERNHEKGTAMTANTEILGTLKHPDWKWEWTMEEIAVGQGQAPETQLVAETAKPKTSPRYFFRMEIGVNRDTNKYVVVGYKAVKGFGYDDPPDVDEWHPEEEFATLNEAVAFAERSDTDFYNAQV